MSDNYKLYGDVASFQQQPQYAQEHATRSFTADQFKKMHDEQATQRRQDKEYAVYKRLSDIVIALYTGNEKELINVCIGRAFTDVTPSIWRHVIEQEKSLNNPRFGLMLDYMLNVLFRMGENEKVSTFKDKDKEKEQRDTKIALTAELRYWFARYFIDKERLSEVTKSEFYYLYEMKYNRIYWRKVEAHSLRLSLWQSESNKPENKGKSFNVYRFSA